MEKRAKEFLELSGRLYEQNRIKWKTMVDGFDEDIYNDTIIKCYDSILKGADTEGDLVGYWYKSFKTNIKRGKTYSYNKLKEDKDITDILKDKEQKENDITIYFSDICDILLKVRHKFDRKTFEVFRMYLLCGISYDVLSDITGIDAKDRIIRIRKWLNGQRKIQDNRRVSE